MATKAQILTFLDNKKTNTPKGSVKYFTIGALKILVSNDIITPAQIAAEFPELP